MSWYTDTSVVRCELPGCPMRRAGDCWHAADLASVQVCVLCGVHDTYGMCWIEDLVLDLPVCLNCRWYGEAACEAAVKVLYLAALIKIFGPAPAQRVFHYLF
jgi:hypothetical protein